MVACVCSRAVDWIHLVTPCATFCSFFVMFNKKRGATVRAKSRLICYTLDEVGDRTEDAVAPSGKDRLSGNFTAKSHRHPCGTRSTRTRGTRRSATSSSSRRVSHMTHGDTAMSSRCHMVVLL